MTRNELLGIVGESSFAADRCPMCNRRPAIETPRLIGKVYCEGHSEAALYASLAKRLAQLAKVAKLAVNLTEDREKVAKLAAQLLELSEIR